MVSKREEIKKHNFFNILRILSFNVASKRFDGHCTVGYVVVPLDESIHGRRLVGTVVGASKKTRQSGLNVQEGIFTDTCIITIGTRRTQTRLSRKAISRKLSSKRSPFRKISNPE